MGTYKNEPVGANLVRNLPFFSEMSPRRRLSMHRISILLITFLAYACFHASRKPISVVKNELLKCHNETDPCESWIYELDGVDEDNAERLAGVLDSTYLFAYAFFMFVSGILAERFNLRYFLSIGMILSGVFTILFGLAFYINVHSIGYFIAIQFFCGVVQTTGWPSVVTIVANWFGKSKKGLVFGLWNSHTNVGNILGSTLAGLFIGSSWGLSFIVPGALIVACGIFVFFFMIASPEDINLDIEDLSGDKNSIEDKQEMTTKSIELGASTNFLVEDNIVEKDKAISFIGALKIPGVLEFALCLFFAKLVSYVFLFWLPYMISEKGENVDPAFAAYFSTLFDVGGIIGGVVAGLATDITGKSAITCAIMLVGAIPMLFGYHTYMDTCPLDDSEQNSCYYGHLGILLTTGLLVNGPYALITTAVSAELGTHESLKGSGKALATVTSVIDGTGSIGAAIGPFLAGAIGTDQTFYMLIAADGFALLLLTRLVVREVKSILEDRKQKRLSNS